MKLLTLLTPLIIVLALAAQSNTQSNTQGVWSEKARMLEPRGEVAAATIDGKIYVLGGSALGDDAQTLNEEYDPATDRWRVRAAMPRGLSHVGAVGMNGRIYVVGGFIRNVHMGAQDAALEYDPAKDPWKTLTPMKTPRGSVGLAALNGKLYAVGGRGVDTVTVVKNAAYDPPTAKRTDLAPLA